MRTTDRVVRNTVSVEVRKSVIPPLRARNFTRESVWPRFGAKLTGSALNAGVGLEAYVFVARASSDRRIAEANARRALDLMVVSFGRDDCLEHLRPGPTGAV